MDTTTTYTENNPMHEEQFQHLPGKKSDMNDEPLTTGNKDEFIKNIFDEETGFGESDCAGL